MPPFGPSIAVIAKMKEKDFPGKMKMQLKGSQEPPVEKFLSEFLLSQVLEI